MRKALPLLVAGLLVLTAGSPLFARLVGDPVPFTGTVTRSDGSPVAGVTVVVELRRESFRILKLKRKSSQAVRMVARTDANGRWSVDWAWDRHHNRFAIAWGVLSDEPGSRLAELERRDVTELVEARGPVVADLVLDDSPWTRWISSYLDGRASADQIRVFQEQGRPDRTESIETAGTAELVWFFFEEGKAYRFAGGQLAGVEDFAPVAPGSGP